MRYLKLLEEEVVARIRWEMDYLGSLKNAQWLDTEQKLQKLLYILSTIL